MDEVCQPLAPYVRNRFGGSGTEGPEDVLQDVLVAIVRGLDGCRAETDVAFWSFCYTVARNQLVDRYRKRGLDLLSMPEGGTLERLIDENRDRAEPLAGGRFDFEYAHALLEAANPPCRELLWSRFVLDVDYETIARTLGLHYDAARRRVERCLKLARDLIRKNP